MLKLMSWNIQCARTPSGAADLDLVAERVAGVADLDIVLLQEVGCGVRGRDGAMLDDQFAGLAARLEGLYGVSALGLDLRADDGRACGIGCMTFSRHPILQVRRHALPWPADPDPESDIRSTPRIALETLIATPLGPLRVLNTHLEYFSLRQRLAQVERLRDIQAEGAERARVRAAGSGEAGGEAAAIPRPAGALLAGDFNLLPGSECHERLFAPGADGVPLWLDAWTQAHPDRVHAPTVGVNDHGPGAVPFTFDYACVSPELAARVRDMRVDTAFTASDHQPLLIDLA